MDLLRGLIMIVMALDPTRDYFHFSTVHGVNPVDLAATTPWIFFTRCITHFCAPIFSFSLGRAFISRRAAENPNRNLPATYFAWLFVVVSLYPRLPLVCRPETPAPRCLAELFLRTRRTKDLRPSS